MAERRELVTAANADAVAEPAAGDPASCVGDVPEAPDDRPPFEIGDGGNQRQDDEHGKEDPGLHPVGRRVDPGLRSKNEQTQVGMLGEGLRSERAELAAFERHLVRVGRRPEGTGELARPSRDPAGTDERDVSSTLDPCATADTLGQASVDGHAGDDPAKAPTASADGDRALDGGG